MNIFIYDGSFEGLLTAIYEAFYRRIAPEDIVPQERHKPDLLTTPTFIEACPEKADKVYNSILKKISKETLQYIYYVFISEEENAGRYIFDYLRLGWRLGFDINQHLLDPRVMKIHQISKRVTREKHRMLGLLRFQRIGELYYAELEPDYNIVGLLAPHFAERMSDQNWMIHDLKREIAALYDRQEWVLIDADKDDIPKPEARETTYEELWKAYYKHISIPERKNPKLQKRCMPVRYWKHLTEKR